MCTGQCAVVPGGGGSALGAKWVGLLLAQNVSNDLPHDLVHPCHSDHAENLHGGLHFFLLQADVSTSFMLQLFTLINFVLMMFLVRVLIPVPHGWEQAAQELHFPTSHCGGFGQSSATHCLSW